MQRPFHNGRKCPFGCNGYVTAVAAGQSQQLCSGVGIFHWHYLSSLKRSIGPRGPPLKDGGSHGVEVLELALHGGIYLVVGVRGSKGEAGET